MIKTQYNSRMMMVLVGAAAAVLAMASLVNTALAESPVDAPGASDTHVVHIYDRDTEKVIVTKARTVREALKAAQVDVSEHKDAVEPALDTELISSKYSVNIFRARPVTVIDGNQRLMITTAQQTPELIAKAAGVALYAEDRASLGEPSNVLLDGANLVMTIDRATKLQLTLYGKTVEVRTRAKTVGDLLQEKRIELGSNDTVSVPLDTALTDGLHVTIWRNGKQTITVEEQIAPPVEKIQDTNRPAGYRQVKEEGQPGLKTVTYEIEMYNGDEKSRREVASVVTREPKKRIEVVGLAPSVAQYRGGGNKDQWLAASNIPRDQWGYADRLVQKESGWNPNARNRSSGACGLAQALPCSKVPGNPLDPVNSLNWMHNYVIGRYGSWEKAVRHSQQRGWY